MLTILLWWYLPFCILVALTQKKLQMQRHLQPMLGSIPGNTRIIALGEATHRSVEFQQYAIIP